MVKVKKMNGKDFIALVKKIDEETTEEELEELDRSLHDGIDLKKKIRGVN